MAHAEVPDDALSNANFQRMYDEKISERAYSIANTDGEGSGAHKPGDPRWVKPVRARTRLPAPDGGCAAWSMVAGAFVVMMHSSSMLYITGIFYVAWLDEWPNESRAAVAGAGSISSTVMFACAYFSGRLQYQWKSQGAVVALGAVLASSGLLAASYAKTLVQLYFSYALMGFGHAFSFTPCPVLVSTWFTSRTGAALGVTTAGASVGTIYLSILASLLIQSSGWRVAFRWLAVLTLVGVGGTAQFFHVPGGKRAYGTLLNGIAKRCCGATNDSTENSSRSDSAVQGSDVNVELSSIYSKSNGTAETAKPTVSSSSSEATSMPTGQRSYSTSILSGASETSGQKYVSKGQLQVYALLQHPRFGRLCAAYFLISLPFGVPFIHLTRFALDKGMPVHTADLLSAGVGAGGMSRILIAAASDRYGRERCFTAVLITMTIANATLPVLINSVAGAMVYAVVIGACTGCLVALVLPLANSALAEPKSSTKTKAQPRASAKAALLRAARQSSRGASSANILKRNAALAAEAAADWPPSSSITSGLVYTMLAVGHEIGPVVCGALYDSTGSYNWGFWFTSIFCGAAAAVATALIPQADTCLDGCGNGSCCGFLYSKLFGDSESIWYLGDDDVVILQDTWADTSSDLPKDSPKVAQSPLTDGTGV